MSPVYNPDDIEKFDAEAPIAGYGNTVNYGRLYMTPQVFYWKPTGKVKEDGKSINEPARRPLQPGETLAQGEVVELTFEVKISEFNTALDFEYTRSIRMENSGPKQKADWQEIVKPSLIAAFGEKWAKVVAENPYVEVEDVPNINESVSKNSTTGNPWGVPKFLRAFGQSKADCAAAREARFGKKDGDSHPVPGGATSAPFVPSAAVITQVKGLLGSVGADQARQMLSNRPFANQPGGDFDADTLLAAAAAA